MRPLIYLVAGARPDFMKIAPIVRALTRYGGFEFRIIHTGQHHDRDMSGVFFDELGIPPPDIFMGAGSGSHSQQAARTMVAFEAICESRRPDVVLVVGDVNSTLACSIAAKKLNIPIVHVEAGLRSGDTSMPEEINRIVTDSITDRFFVTEPSAVNNLRDEGKSPSAIHYVAMSWSTIFSIKLRNWSNASHRIRDERHQTGISRGRQALRRGDAASSEQHRSTRGNAVNCCGTENHCTRVATGVSSPLSYAA